MSKPKIAKIWALVNFNTEIKTINPLNHYNLGGLIRNYTAPWAIIESATFTNPPMLAPST